MSLTKNVVCPGCTCLCDDIEMKRDGSAVSAVNACHLGSAFFDFTPASHLQHYVDSKPVDQSSAVEAAAQILKASQAPLICGIDQLTTQAQQTAWKIADQIGATIDSTFSNRGRASMFALQKTGKVTASLGEIANRSDLIVFWFCDPETTHPRLWERLDRPDAPHRRVVVIDEYETATAKKADTFIQVDPGKAPAVLAVLRAALNEIWFDKDLVDDATGLRLSDIHTLLGLFRAAKYGSILFGQTHHDSSFDLATDSLSCLIQELNDVTRFVGIKLRTDANAQSAENVLAWSCGYPFAVNHRQDMPRFNGLEHSAETTLRRRECDAILLATGADFQANFSNLADNSLEFMKTIPSIAFTPIAKFPSSVSFQINIPGLDGKGEYCRFDDVSLPLNRLSREDPSSAASRLLEQLLRRLG